MAWAEDSLLIFHSKKSEGAMNGWRERTPVVIQLGRECREGAGFRTRAHPELLKTTRYNCLYRC